MNKSTVHAYLKENQDPRGIENWKKVYDGPHLQADLGSQVVTAKYTAAYTVTYDFNTDSITTSRKPSVL